MKAGSRVVRFGFAEGKLTATGGTVLTEGTPIVSVAFDTGDLPDLSKEEADKLALEGCCIACGQPLVESQRFCGGCGALNVYEAAGEVLAHLKLDPNGSTPIDLQDRLVAAAKSRLGEAAKKAKAVRAPADPAEAERYRAGQERLAAARAAGQSCPTCSGSGFSSSTQVSPGMAVKGVCPDCEGYGVPSAAWRS